ncbi:MAG: response regulator [Desulfohalobiaceae bacterium]
MSGSEKVKILLVDDDQTLLEYLAKRLQREGLSARPTFSGEEALEVVVDEDFDVAVVDLKMPGMDGVETQRRLKEVLPLLQCVVLTGYSSIDSALKSGQQGAYDYLFKPVDYESLVASIREAFERKRELEKAEMERAENEESSSGGSARGIGRIWNFLREAYRVPEH